MQITLRSHLIAGTAAVVGAGAIAMTPVTAAHLPTVQVPSMAQVALAGYDSPVSELLSSIGLGGYLMFDNTQDPTKAASWPYSGISKGTGFAAFVWPDNVLGTDAAGGYKSVGLVPQIIEDHLPIISQLGFNGSNYLQVAIGGLGGAAYTLSEGTWNALGDLLTLNIPGALNELVSSVQSAGQEALDAGTYVLQNVLAKTVAVVQYLAGDLPVLLGTTLKQVQVLVGALIAPVKNAIAALGQPQPIEGVWNSVVDGLLGPSGIPGTVLNLSIGAGVQTGPISGTDLPSTKASIAANFVPSVRTEVQAGVKGVAKALTVTPMSAAARRAEARKSVRAAASDAPSLGGLLASRKAAKAAASSDSTSTGNHRAARGAAAKGAAS